jgi:hypothetical protein
MARWTRAVFALLLVAAAACSDDGDEAAAITDASLDAHPVSAISAVLTVETEADTSVSVAVDGPGGGFQIPADEPTTSHEIPVVGMRAESDYTLTVTAEPDGGGEAATQTLDWTTGSLPDDLPAVTATVADTARTQPGYTVFNAFAWDAPPEGATTPDAGYVIAVDHEGEIVWYARTTHQILDVDTTPRGTFVVTDGDAVLMEIDLFGAVVREWGTHIATDVPGKDLDGRPFGSDKTVPIDIDSSHHEITELANGDVITISTEVIELDEADAARLCPDNPEATIVGDIAVELSPDGEVVQTWPLSSVYDPAETPGSEMCVEGLPVAPPNWFYPESGRTRDWTHANAVEVHEDDNMLLVSSRHLDEVMALRYHDDDEGKAGELLWSIGLHGTLELTGEPPHHQHAMELEDDGTLMMYDNGNLRPGTVVGGGSAPPFSRAVRYEIDVDAGTATQVWDHRDTWSDGRTVFTPFLGDVDLEPNGNVLITHGGGSTADGEFQAKIVEVVPGDAPDGSADEVVLDLVVSARNPAAAAGPHGWSVYRSVRLESLYFAS